MIDETKSCAWCGEPFARRENEAPGEFAKRLCCSRSHAQFMNNTPRRGKPNPAQSGERNGMWGRTHTPEARELQRHAALAHPLGSESLAKIAAKNRGRRRTDETRQRQSVARRAFWEAMTPEQRTEWRDRQRVTNWDDPATREKKRQTRIAWWARLSPEARQAYAQVKREQNVRLMESGRYNVLESSIERLMAMELARAGIPYRQHVPLCERWIADFVIDAPTPIVIECDGDYWHNRPEVRTRDALKNADLSAAGYVVLRFWEHDLLDDVTRCVDHVHSYLR